MSQPARSEIARKPVLFQLPGMSAVKVRGDVEYRAAEAGGLTMDLYYPPDWQSGTRAPAIVFVSGYSDLGMQVMLGCKLKDMECYVSWGRLTAVSGMIGITYATREPMADLPALFESLGQHAAELGLDENRIGVWACSGNVPMALSLLMLDPGRKAKCAALCYGYMLDLDGGTGIAESSKAFGFANPCAGKSVQDIPKDVPVFVVRAGRDQTPRLNESIDRFVNQALACNLPITFANHANAPHAFDLFDDSEATRALIRQILAWLQSRLAA